MEPKNNQSGTKDEFQKIHEDNDSNTTPVEYSDDDTEIVQEEKKMPDPDPAPASAMPTNDEKAPKLNKSKVVQRIIIVVALILAVAGGAYAVYHFTKADDYYYSDDDDDDDSGAKSEDKSEDISYKIKDLSEVMASSQDSIALGQTPVMEEEYAPAQDAPRSYVHMVTRRKLTEQDLAPYSKAELRLMRNTIYAIHGRRFTSPDLQRYFSQFPWYHPSVDEIAPGSLNEIETYNAAFIMKHE